MGGLEGEWACLAVKLVFFCSLLLLQLTVTGTPSKRIFKWALDSLLAIELQVR